MPLNRTFLFVTFFLLAVSIFAGCSIVKKISTPNGGRNANPAKATADAGKRFKILHIMSYHSPWEWTDAQFEGFKDAMRGVEVEYKVIQLDAKNRSSQDWLQGNGLEAQKMIDAWRPNLVYTSDDEAIEYVTKRYAGASTTFVFSGVNKTLQNYGLDGSPNIAGVLEIEHFVQSAALFKKIVPGAKKIAVVFDDAPMWEAVAKRMHDMAGEAAGLEFIAWDTIKTFDEYKRRMKEYESLVDGVCLVGIFNFKDENGKNVHYREVLRWTAANSRLPDFSFWIDRVYYGTLCVVSVSAYEQGMAAGKIAREILVNGRDPATLPIRATTKGQAGINLARAKILGLIIDSKTLLSAKVVNKFGWE